MTEYNIGYQQIINVNVDDVSYELKFVGQVVYFEGNANSAIYLSNVPIYFTEGETEQTIDVSAYAEDNIEYFPVLVASDAISKCIATRCLYSTSKTVTIYNETTTLEGSHDNTLALIPVKTEGTTVEGITNGQFYGTSARGYSKAEINALLADKQDLIDATHKLNADLVDDSTSTNKLVTQTEIDSWNEKQGELTFDSTPTPNSTNPVTSGGIYTALEEKQLVSNLVTSVSSASTNFQYPSAKLFYDTCGDIETLINAL